VGLVQRESGLGSCWNSPGLWEWVGAVLGCFVFCGGGFVFWGGGVVVAGVVAPGLGVVWYTSVLREMISEKRPRHLSTTEFKL